MAIVIRRLPVDFFLSRYGIDVRLVTEDDADFVVSLRNNERVGDFLHTTGNVENQKLWTREYKIREIRGEEYYFVFSHNGKPFGLARIYNIDRIRCTCTGGSWVCKPNTPFELSMLTIVIITEIEEALGLLIDIYEVNKKNLQVLNFHRKIQCAYEYGVTNKDILFMSTPETRKKSKLRKLLGIPNSEEMDSIPYIEETIEY